MWKLPLAVALYLMASPALGAQAENTEQPSVTVSNSPGAVTGNNNQVNIYQEARDDPVTRQFVTTLRRYTNTMATKLQPNPEIPVYMFSTDSHGEDRSVASTGNIYWIIVGDLDEEEDGWPVQDCGDDFGLYGFVFSATLQSNSSRTRMRILAGQERLLLDQICRGLRMPLSTLVGGEPDHLSNSTQIFHFLARGNVAFAVMLMPSRSLGQEAEESLTRSFWPSAFALRYNRTPRPDSMTPEGFAQLERFQTGQWTDIEMPVPPGYANPTSYSSQARREFGDRLDRLDADWIAYLRSSSVTVQNKQRPVWDGEQPARFVTRFTLREVGTPEFWRSANDLRDTMDQMNCIAQQFLVDLQYVPPDESTLAGRCPLGEIRTVLPDSPKDYFVKD